MDDAGGMLLLELNRVLRPGGFFVWSATPVYQTLEEDVEIWKGKVIGEKHNMFNKQATTKLMGYFFLQKCLLWRSPCVGSLLQFRRTSWTRLGLPFTGNQPQMNAMIKENTSVPPCAKTTTIRTQHGKQPLGIPWALFYEWIRHKFVQH